MVLETHMKLCVAELDFLENIFLPPTLLKNFVIKIFTKFVLWRKIDGMNWIFACWWKFSQKYALAI